MQRKVARSHGLGFALLNRLLAHWIVLRLRWNHARTGPETPGPA